MLVRDVMRKNVITVRPSDPLAVAAQTMVWMGLRHLPVMRDGRLVGIISERDLLRHRAEAKDPEPLANPVERAMRSPAHFIAPDASITEAAERMAANTIGCLPVVERGDLVGILTATDLLALHVRQAYSSSEVREPLPTAQELMTSNPISADRDEYVVNAIARMAMAGVRHLPIVDGRDRLIGMLSDRDIRLRSDEFIDGALRLRDQTLRVSALMRADVPTVKPDTRYGDLVAAFSDWRVSALAVVDEAQHLKGIVSYVDVLGALRDPATEGRSS
jgi:predicted transcriptional regulator